MKMKASLKIIPAILAILTLMAALTVLEGCEQGRQADLPNADADAGLAAVSPADKGAGGSADASPHLDPVGQTSAGNADPASPSTPRVYDLPDWNALGWGPADPELAYNPAMKISEMPNSKYAIADEVTIESPGNRNSYDISYLFSDEPVYDLLISEIYEYAEDEVVNTYIDRYTLETVSYLELRAYYYMPELPAGQALRLNSNKWYNERYRGLYSTRIAYTTSSGKYETVTVRGGSDGTGLRLSPISNNLAGMLLDENTDLPADVEARVNAGEFAGYIPAGFRVSNISLGDINSDGIEDALASFSSDCFRAVSYEFISRPMLMLIGQPDGGYEVAHKIPGVWYSFPKSSGNWGYSASISAGDGFVDYCVGYTSSPMIYMYRYQYDAGLDDWVLSEIYDGPGTQDEARAQLVKATPDLRGFLLSTFTQRTHAGALIDQSTIDTELADFKFVPLGSLDPNFQSSVLAVKLDAESGRYYGYVFWVGDTYLDAGESPIYYLMQTICGENPHEPPPDMADAESGGSPALTVVVDEESATLTIQDDVWLAALAHNMGINGSESYNYFIVKHDQLRDYITVTYF